MDLVRALADLSIRRACGFAGLAIAVVMLALSYDLSLSLRVGAALTALFCLCLAAAAWRAPRRDLRRSELWALLAGSAEDGLAENPLRHLPRDQAQRVLAEVLRDRLYWHAERAGVASLALWAVAWLAVLLDALLG